MVHPDFHSANNTVKALANEDTLLRTYCYRHKCFPVCPRAQHLLRTQILCPGHENVSDFVQKHFVSATNVSQFAQPKKHHEQPCVRNNVSCPRLPVPLRRYEERVEGLEVGRKLIDTTETSRHGNPDWSSALSIESRRRGRGG